VVGICLGAALARLLSRLLFGVSPFDAWSFSAAAILMLVVAMLASGVPALRAARLDPLAAFRGE
jgi:putative ABC transport system permease protein